MKKEPTQSEIDSVASHLVVRGKSGCHLVADCPACSKKEKLYFNTRTGKWDCKAGKCGEAGSLFRLATILNIEVRQNRLIEGPGTHLVAHFQANAHKTVKGVVRNAKNFNLDYVTRLVDDMLEGDERMLESLEYMHSRGFDDTTIQHFRLCPWRMPKTKDLAAEPGIAIPYIVDGKVPLAKLRNLKSGKKRRFTRTKGKDSLLFNGQAIRNCREVILMEAELDAISVWQLGQTNVAATSLGAKKELPADWLHQLSRADRIVLWYDDDEAGQEAVAGLLVQLGTHRCDIATLSSAKGLLEEHPDVKDANDILMLDVDEDRKREWVKQIVSGAKPVEQTDLVQIQALAHAVLPTDLSVSPLGIPTGLSGLDNLVRGWRPSETTIFTGHSGHGKTTFASWCAEYVARTHPVLMTSFENGPEDIASKRFQREFKRPISSIKTEEDLAEAHSVLERALENPNLFIANVRGQQDKQKFFDMVRWGVARLGIRYVLVDHLGYFKYDPMKGSEYRHIQDLVQELAELAKELKIHIWIVAHVNGAVDERSVPMGGNLKGGSAVKQEADQGITVYRNFDLTGSTGEKDLKVRDGAGRVIKVTLGPKQSLIYVWKKRHVEANVGVFVADFNPGSLTYSSPYQASEADEDELGEIDDPQAGFLGF